MQYYQPGSVVLLTLPFSDATTFKRRPALVLSDAGDNDIVVSRITTQIYRTDFDVEILEWQQAGLMRPSVVRLHKLNTVEKKISTSDIRNFRAKRLATSLSMYSTNYGVKSWKYSISRIRLLFSLLLII
ncbi:hypothetical protein NIES4071_85990 [Calothrix sp. NIES-4071]|nr:hypothetical protein NIES4071_85990 [Calothrix sp. NIES-4071]BAZ62866.1 hypothetical protein NIES4105_85920 [Calothrix sp. NIES-4105]